MKKIMILIVFAFVAFAVQVEAQDITVYKPGVVTLMSSDTINNTQSGDTTVLFKYKNDEPYYVTVHVIGAQISGTIDLDVDYEWSNDGTNFVAISSDSIAAGNLQYMFEETSFAARYFRLTWTGVGTNSTRVKAYMNVLEIP